MLPPVFETVSNDSDVVGIFSDNGVVRIYPFGNAPCKSPTPYAVWKLVTGKAEACLSGIPDVDGYIVKIEVYSKNIDEAMEGAEALRSAIEPSADVIAYRDCEKVNDTVLYKYGFDIHFLVER